MTYGDAAIVALGALAGGFVSGLAGFGTGLVALGIWLHAVPPVVAAALAAICSVIGQTLTIHTVWHVIEFRKIWPMLLAGVIGVPIGVALLAVADPAMFRLGTGVLLIVYSVVMLAGGSRIAFHHGGRAADTVVAFAGGILGGLAGLSGPLPTMWATLRGWTKDQRRAFFQSFNLVVLFVTFCVFVVSGLVTRQAVWAILFALPGTVAGSILGAHLYHRQSDSNFQRLVLCILAMSGAVLVWPFFARASGL